MYLWIASAVRIPCVVELQNRVLVFDRAKPSCILPTIPSRCASFNLFTPNAFLPCCYRGGVHRGTEEGRIDTEPRDGPLTPFPTEQSFG